MSKGLWRMSLLAALMGMSSAHAKISYDITNKTQVATVAGISFSPAVLEVMYKVSSAKKPELSRAAVLNALIENQLMGQYGLKRFGKDKIVEDNKVSFKPAILEEQEYRAIMQIAFAKPLGDALKQFGGKLDNTLSNENSIKASEWDTYLPSNKTMQLEFALSATGKVAAAKRVLVNYRFDDKNTGAITFSDVYYSQNVQGRDKIHSRESDYVSAQARELVVNRYVEYWVKTASGLTEADIASIKQAITNKTYHDGFASYIGIAADIHDDVPYVKSLAAKVTKAEIKSYYNKHKNEFKRIEKVKAQHITVADEKTANTVADLLKKGGKFDELARQYSIAADKDKGGDLGWIIHDLKNPSWLSTLAFMQSVNTPSRPVRTPNGQWEILFITQKDEGYQAVDSDSVRYVAAQIIARQKAATEYRQIRMKLIKEADIHIHKSFQGQSSTLEGDVVVAPLSDEDHHQH
ncbi:MAG: peptidyl-prolyl cis-trans isomerase [Agitococcus sp.]|nr:peptidyl-prolyl cis-trans isomerase [Agitococcus sp.]